ncbi:MAG TPA: hypothetical protein VI564_01975 [Candidatus Nanoarchaeia archaeon]|nr:hypothetical protein [Candidatus Nanoarchaeia archaeon]
MGHVKIIVDHEKLEYSGPFSANDLFKSIENFLMERGFDKKQEKDFEQNTSNGKFIEWQINPWKRITDYVRYMVKVRVLGYEIVKTDLVVDGKKKKVDTGRVIIVIDGFIEYDYESRWEDNPFLFLMRTAYDYFINKVYTENFEQKLSHDINHLYDHIEKFFNMYRHYSVISSHVH